MSMSKISKFAVGAVLGLIAVLHNHSSAHQIDSHHGPRDCDKPKNCQPSSSVVSVSVAGPNPYHSTYAAIENTRVTIQDFILRTEDGEVITVRTNPMTINMQDLKGFTKGLQLDLTQVGFPGGAAEIELAEIQTNVLEGASPNAAISTGNLVCPLAVPAKLVFYAEAPFVLGHDAYHVKVDFKPINGIQINLVTTTTRTQCCHGHHGNAYGHDKDDKDDKSKTTSSCSDGSQNQTTEKSCKLVNKRYAISLIPRAADDAF
jgi:hypothetical protein